MTRVLVVEDSPTQAEILRAILVRSGFVAEVATDAEEALHVLEGSSFDLIISDIVMPGMSGYELCQKIKSGPHGRDMPVILLTSLNDPMDIIRGLECEADSFITKPYQADRLLARIHSLLENKHARVSGGVKFGVELVFLGKKFLITSEKEQILDLLISTFEDTVRTNLGLQKTQADLFAAKRELETYTRELEQRVRERTEALEQNAEQLKEALDASNKSEARFRSMVSNLGVPIFVCDRETFQFLHTNDAAVREYGYSQSEFLKLGVKDLLVPADPISPEEACKTLIDPARHVGRRHRGKNGGIIDVELTGTVLEFEGRPAILVVANNVTERIKIEAQVRHNERLDAVGSITGGVAHDFNNLLTVVKATAEELRDELVNSPLRQSAEMVLEAADRGAELVRHLMAFARKQELAPTSLDVNVLVDTVIKLMRRALPANIAIKLQKAAKLPLVNVDAGRLENALLNLAVNARDAMPSGGEIVIETSVVDLDEQYARENSDVHAGPYVLIALSDTGTGMPQDVIDHAFEPFFTTKGVGKGTGLGLSMVYGLIKQSGGHAKIYSVIGKGTTIKMYLPAVAGKIVVDEKPLQKTVATAPTLGAGNMLLVEDDDLVRKSVTAKLQRLGYVVTAVTSAGEAISMLETRSDFKLMLSDVMMPGTMTGADLAREVLQRWPHIGVLLSSGYTESSIGTKARIPEGVRLLSKPYSNTDLAQALAETLSRVSG